MKWFQYTILSFALLSTAGCTVLSNSRSEWLLPPMVEAIQPSLQQEVQIARFSQLLARSDIPEKTRAEIFFKRGNAYDSVGLRNLARLDYEQSLAINPAQANLFNLLGVYFTEKRNFDAAYDAFNSSLELAPDNGYTARNRAIAFYYGGRMELALEDMQQYHDKHPSDPFSALWLYIIKSKLSPQIAQHELKQSYLSRNDKWGWIMVAIALGEISEKQAFEQIMASTRDNVLLAQRLTEAYFYLGKRYQQNSHSEHDIVKAISFYRLAISFNVFEYVEHRYAQLELYSIYRDIQKNRVFAAKPGAKAKLE